MNASRQGKCVFCERLLPGLSDDPWDTPLAETDQYLIVPTKGSLVPGWLLVVSKQHALCAGELQLSEFGDLERAILMAKAIVERHFGPATIFEHGPAHNGTSLGCGIDHLHFHVAPLKFSLAAAVDLVVPTAEWRGLAQLQELRSLHLRGLGYAVVIAPEGVIRWFLPPSGIRQPLRRAIASYLGSAKCFDYARYPYTDNVLQTLEQVAAGI